MTRRTIFITGAASGIGRETALLFAKRGWFVGLYDLNPAPLKALEQEIGAGQCCWRRLDVTDLKEYRDALAMFATKTSGRMDALFNCAGIMAMGPFGEVPLEEHLRTVDVNVKGVVAGTWLALPLLRKSDDPVVVTMGSSASVYGVPDLAVYAASKFAVRGLTEGLELELGAKGIRVTDIMPLYADTQMMRSQTREAGTLKTLGVKTTAAEVAEAVWTAVHGRKRPHWLVGTRLKVMVAFGKLFPFASRWTMKRLSGL